MDLYNEDDPNDDFLTREKKRWRRTQIARILAYQAGLKNNGLKIDLSPRPDFDLAANDNSVAFLTKIISKVTTAKDPTTDQNVITAIYDNHFTVHYLPQTDKQSECLRVVDLNLDYTSKAKVKAEQAVIEKVKCAMILAHSANAMGWTKVNFNGTDDQLSRYILKVICRDIGLDAESQNVEMDKIPPYAAFNGGLPQKAYDVYLLMKENAALTVANQKHPAEKPEADIKIDEGESPFAFADEGPQPSAA